MWRSLQNAQLQPCLKMKEGRESDGKKHQSSLLEVKIQLFVLFITKCIISPPGRDFPETSQCKAHFLYYKANLKALFYFYFQTTVHLVIRTV